MLEKLSRTYVDGYGTAAKFNSEILRLAKSQDVQATSVAHLEQVYAGMQRRFGLQADASALQVRGYTDLAKAIDNVNGRLTEQRRLQASMPANGMSPLHPAGANDNSAQFRRQNAGYQYFDVAQSLSLGMNPAMILAQQGPQLIQIYAGQGGVNAAIKDFTSIVGGAARAVGPLVAILAGGYAGYKLLESYSVEAGLAVSETTKALAAQAAPLGSLQGQIGELTSLQQTYNQAVRDSASASAAATSIILDNTEREYNAKRSLLELEERRLAASIEVQKSEIAIAQARLKADLSQQVNTRLDLERQGFADPRIGRFVALPDEITGLEKTRQLLASNALTDKIKELQANLELTEIGAEKLREALAKSFDTKPYGTGDLPIIGPVPTARPNRELEGDARQDSASARFFQSQTERIEAVRLEMSLIGQSESVRRSATAALQAEQQIRQMGLETYSAEAKLIRENASALSEMEESLRRQSEAWGMFQSAGEDAIDGVLDKLTSGDFKGAIGEAAKALQSFIWEAPIKTKLKNSLWAEEAA
ncbi:phage tail length tape measure family protein [Rhizobium sp. Leaf453]|uniref:phage tail length tape measure family protein n=1 Tax=Rhizobium sp. Leaf453 TaxID=1736380 RepID=UPI00138F9CD1|nr:phage tail length tape measure family protein [Rhizobium sp. Leaf453]